MEQKSGKLLIDKPDKKNLLFGDMTISEKKQKNREYREGKLLEERCKKCGCKIQERDKYGTPICKCTRKDS